MTATAYERVDRATTRDNITGREWAVTIKDGDRVVTRVVEDRETAIAVAAHINGEES